MAVFVLVLAFFFAFAGFSDANYCVCNSGLSDSVLQKNIDWACGNGADCTQIQQNGPCFNPNTVKDHCNYAVNSYYQRKGNIAGSCDFQGTAAVVPNAPSQGGSACVFPSGPSNGGSTTPMTPGTPATGGTPMTPGTPATGGTPATPGTPISGGTPTTPGTPMGGTPTSPGAFPGSGTTGVPGSPTTPGFGLGPTGSGFGNTDSSSNPAVNLSRTIVFLSMVVISAFVCPMI